MYNEVYSFEFGQYIKLHKYHYSKVQNISITAPNFLKSLCNVSLPTNPAPSNHSSTHCLYR